MKKSKISTYQIKLLNEYNRMLDISGLSPDRANKFLDDGASEYLLPLLKSMKQELVRGYIIKEYTLIDSLLEFRLLRLFFGTGMKMKMMQKTIRFKNLQKILQKLYPLQKLEIICDNKRKVPKHIRKIIYRLNELRNIFSHSFFIHNFPKSKILYNGMNIFSPKGLEIFKSDLVEVKRFFLSSK